jgi:tRNA threonylcarbamoyladenosine biosynthesis protein TsaB
MIILAVDTSTRTGSVAVLNDDAVLAEVEVTSQETHAKRLVSAIDATLGMTGKTIADCDGFAVTTGPGSFTGLRIGVSTVKGLSFATGQPVAGVSSLDALVYQFPSCPHPICPIIDARKGQVYTALYQSTGHMRWNKVFEDCAVEPEAWLKQIGGPCLFVGEGVYVYAELITQTLGDLAYLAPAYMNRVRASVVGYIGMKLILDGRAADAEKLVPYYIRKSDAEIRPRNSKA